MRFLRCGLLLVLTLPFLVTAESQNRGKVVGRDLSGTWVLARQPGDGIPDASPLFDRGTIVQDATSVTFTSNWGTKTYRLDGTDAVVSKATAAGDPWKLSSQARWVTSALVVATRTNAGATGSWEDMFVCSLSSAAGDTLTVVTVTAVSMPGRMKTALWTYKRLQ